MNAPGRGPLPIRPDLGSVTPYESPQRPARYRMNTNESPYAPPQGLMREVGELLARESLNRYPDADARYLFDALATDIGWPSEGIWIANGSNEVFLHLFLAFGGPGRTCLVFEPTYSLHSLIPRITGTEVIRSERLDDFSVDLGAAVETVRAARPDIVLLCSPNNPSGNCDSADLVRALLAESPGIVVVDEAYIEFARGDRSVRNLLGDHPNLAVTNTFSKAWRLAGVRIGYLLGSTEVTAGMARVRLPYNLSTITQLIGAAALRYKDETLEVVESIKRERDRIATELQALGIKTYPSDANFILFQADDAQCLWDGLLSRDVLVRNYSRHPGLEGCLRVTAGLPEEADAFLGAMKECLDG